jgi:hypothetical protein
MLGLDKRLKEPASLAKKIAKDMAIEGISAEQAAARIRDVVRYTSSFPPDKLVEGTLRRRPKISPTIHRLPPIGTSTDDPIGSLGNQTWLIDGVRYRLLYCWTGPNGAR